MGTPRAGTRLRRARPYRAAFRAGPRFRSPPAAGAPFAAAPPPGQRGGAPRADPFPPQINGAHKAAIKSLRVRAGFGKPCPCSPSLFRAPYKIHILYHFRRPEKIQEWIFCIIWGGGSARGACRQWAAGLPASRGSRTFVRSVVGALRAPKQYPVSFLQSGLDFYGGIGYTCNYGEVVRSRGFRKPEP